MTSRQSRLLILLLGALLLPALLGAAWWRATRSALPTPDAATLRAHWERARPYAAFVAEDTARSAEWRTSEARADSAAALTLPSGSWRLLVVAESWCGDALNTVPYLQAAASRSGVELRLLRKAEATRLLRAHLLEGRRATPLVLVLDSTFAERGAWIEQPAPLRALVRELEGELAEDSLRSRVYGWYAADRGATALTELRALMDIPR